MKHALYKTGILLFLVMLITSGCSNHTVPSQYDLKLKARTKSLVADQGGAITEAEITIDSRRFQELSSEQQIFLSYHILDSNGSPVVNDGIRTALTTIPARGVGKEIVNILAPDEAGEYLVDIDLVEENVTWFSAQGMSMLQIPMTVKESVAVDYSQVTLTSASSHIDIESQAGFDIPITIQNNSGTVLCNSGEKTILVSYRVEDLNGNVLTEGERTPLSQYISSGEDMSLKISPQAEILKIPGTYKLEVGLLIEGTAWLQEWGTNPLSISVTVQ